MNNVHWLVLVLVVTFFESSHAALIKDQVITLDGADRTYDIFVPSAQADSQKETKPLVVLLHGHFGNADVMTGANGKSAPYKVWLSIAEREGWYLVIPDGEPGSDGKRGWNDCRSDAGTNPKSDDVKFIHSLINKISSQYPINQNRIYAHGTSNGGNMVFRLAQESGDKFKAAAAIVASMPENNKCEASNHPISILVMNGTEDPLLAYEGGKIGRGNSDKYERGTVVSTDDTIRYWLKTNRISSKPKVETLANINKRDRSTIELSHYSGGTNDTEVVLYKVIGGGHTEPSLTEHFGIIYKAIVGPQNRDIEMAEEVWRFFERHRE